MVCRSKQRGEEALEEIKKESGNDVCCFKKQKVKIVVHRTLQGCGGSRKLLI